MLLYAPTASAAVSLPSQTATRVYGQNGSFTASTRSPASADTLFRPFAVEVDRAGGLYVADSTNNRVLHFPAGSTTADAVYGQNGSFTTSTCNTGGISAGTLCFPVGMAVDSNGGLYVADSFNARVLYYPPPAVGTDYAQTTATRVYGQNGSFTTSITGTTADTLNDPVGVVLDDQGGIYVGEYVNNRVVHFPAGSTIADAVYGQNGSFTTGTCNNGGISAVSLCNPVGGMAVDSEGGLYVADSVNYRVLHYPPPAGGTDYAQMTATGVYGQNGSFTTNIPGTSATIMGGPASLALDSAGGLYVVDTGNNRVLHFPSGSTTADAVYGQGDDGSFTSGAAGTGDTSLDFPFGVTVDQTGGLYVADIDNNRVLYFAPSASTTVQTLSIPIAVGWNLITLPLSPTTTLDARSVLAGLLGQTQGGYAEIDGYGNGHWTPSLFDDQTDGIGVGGTNFTLQLGCGYALYSDTAGIISITGTPASAQSPALSAGWNLVGFPGATATSPQADDILSTLLGQTHGGYAEIDGYSTGQFSPSAYDDPADGIGLGGTNFAVQPGQGYALYTDVAMAQSL
jgi:sugar lactone lactonase YvrE